jgi:hypothetical protein
MALRKVTYVNNQTVISAENLNAIQDAVIALENAPSGGGGGGDGFSPIATVTQTANGATISITDKNGTTTAEVSDGKDGFSPVATVTQTNSGATISITDKNGTTTATIQNGEGGGGSGGDSVWTESTDHPGCFYRTVSSYFGNEKEWLNPPMIGGVLYRTPERYSGQVVYTMCAGLWDYDIGIPEDGRFGISLWEMDYYGKTATINEALRYSIEGWGIIIGGQHALTPDMEMQEFEEFDFGNSGLYGKFSSNMQFDESLTITLYMTLNEPV